MNAQKKNILFFLWWFSSSLEKNWVQLHFNGGSWPLSQLQEAHVSDLWSSSMILITARSLKTIANSLWVEKNCQLFIELSNSINTEINIYILLITCRFVAYRLTVLYWFWLICILNDDNSRHDGFHIVMQISFMRFSRSKNIKQVFPSTIL